MIDGLLMASLIRYARIGRDSTPYEVKLGEWGGLLWQPAAIMAPKSLASKKPKSGAELEGGYIEVHWPLDNAWYMASVIMYMPDVQKHKIRYADGRRPARCMHVLTTAPPRVSPQVRGGRRDRDA